LKLSRLREWSVFVAGVTVSVESKPHSSAILKIVAQLLPLFPEVMNVWKVCIMLFLCI